MMITYFDVKEMKKENIIDHEYWWNGTWNKKNVTNYSSLKCKEKLFFTQIVSCYILFTTHNIQQHNLRNSIRPSTVIIIFHSSLQPTKWFFVWHACEKVSWKWECVTSVD